MENAGSHKNSISDIVDGRFHSNIVYHEHSRRYAFARQFVKGKAVLDAGCGVGDGTYMLAEAVKNITAIEADKEALHKARQEFNHPNIDYAVCDCRSLCFRNEAFEAVVSLEVIEHFKEQEIFLSEMLRVLKKGGVAVISTPNREMIKKLGSTSNATHVKELTLEEFTDMLSRYFVSVELYGSRRGKGIDGAWVWLQQYVRLDIFRLRSFIPQSCRNAMARKIAISSGAKQPEKITGDDIIISKENLYSASNLIAVCRK